MQFKLLIDVDPHGLTETEYIFIKNLLFYYVEDFGLLPLITPETNFKDYHNFLCKLYTGEFSCAFCFEPNFILCLVYNGFIPMAYYNLLTPKLHRQRCILTFDNLHVSRNVLKKCKKYIITIDKALEKVVHNCQEQHGLNWLSPELASSLCAIFHRQQNAASYFEEIKRLQVGFANHWSTSLHSIEIWDEDNLIAGEFGFAIGGCYQSASGFSNKAYNGAGTIQCVTLGIILKENGFDFWDLGMNLEYKRRLGAHVIRREDFLTLLCNTRDREDLPEMNQILNNNVFCIDIVKRRL